MPEIRRPNGKKTIGAYDSSSKLIPFGTVSRGKALKINMVSPPPRMLSPTSIYQMRNEGLIGSTAEKGIGTSSNLVDASNQAAI